MKCIDFQLSGISVLRIMSPAYQGQKLCGLLGQAVGQFLVKDNQVSDVHVQEVSLKHGVLSQLITTGVRVIRVRECQ
jgi:hypothetical protein